MLNKKTALAEDYVDNKLAVTLGNRSALQESLVELRKFLGEITDDDARRVAYQNVNLALCAKRDAIRDRLGVSKESSATDQIKIFSKDAEGSMLLNAFALTNRGLTNTIATRFAGADKYFHHRSYDRDDLEQAGLYGAMGKGAKGKETKASERSMDGGLLAGAMKYEWRLDSNFSSYIGACIEDGIKSYIRNNKVKQAMRWPGDFKGVRKSDADHIDTFASENEKLTEDVSYQFQKKAVKDAMLHLRDKKKLPDHAEKVIAMRLDNKTLKTIGEEIGLELQSVYGIEARTIRAVRKELEAMQRERRRAAVQDNDVTR